MKHLKGKIIILQLRPKCYQSKLCNLEGRDATLWKTHTHTFFVILLEIKKIDNLTNTF